MKDVPRLRFAIRASSRSATEWLNFSLSFRHIRVWDLSRVSAIVLVTSSHNLKNLMTALPKAKRE